MSSPLAPELPATVGVYGGGRMGAGIAHAFLAAGAAVVVVETDDGAAAAARERVAGSLRGAEERGKLDGTAAEALARLEVTTDLVGLDVRPPRASASPRARWRRRAGCWRTRVSRSR